MAEQMAKERVTEPADLLTVRIAGETPAQRLESYLTQVGDPYRVRVGQTPVRLLFHDEERPLPEKLSSYFLYRKSSGF